MYLFYLDDSSDGKLYVFSALGVKEEHWKEVFGEIKKMRQTLKKHAGIYINKELHAWKFVSGRGRPSPQFLSKEIRARIFRYVLKTLASIGPEKLILFNVANTRQDYAYERLMNRINRTMRAKDNFAMIISDEGKEAEYTKLIRKMGVYNPIPSRFGVWDGGKDHAKNIPIDRIIEDPVFRQSDASFFIQAVDFCAYALLRHERPLESKAELNNAFGFLEPICAKQANRNDPLGIIR
jgi:hypothetical protein